MTTVTRPNPWRCYDATTISCHGVARHAPPVSKIETLGPYRLDGDLLVLDLDEAHIHTVDIPDELYLEKSQTSTSTTRKPSWTSRTHSVGSATSTAPPSEHGLHWKN